MGRAALLALALLAGAAVCSATPASRWLRLNSEGDDPEPSCLTYTDEDSCLEHACGWCSSSSVLGELQGCLADSVARLVPDILADCKVPDEPSDDDYDEDDDDDDIMLSQDGGDDPDKPKPKKPTSCGDNKEKRACLDGAEEGDCAWCKGDFMPASCVGVKAAEWIPAQVAKCKMPKKHKKDDDDKDLRADPDKPKPKKPTSCGDNKEKRDCLDVGAEEGDCAWCKGDFMPESCVGVKAAQWIPAQVAKCKMPKKHKKDDDDKDLRADLDKPKPKPTSCGDNKEKRDCLDVGAEEGDCAWCKGDFMPESCVGVKAAQWIPTQVAKCKMPKKHKKHDDDDDGGDIIIPDDDDVIPGDDDDIIVAVDKEHGKKKKERAATCEDVKDRKECVREGADEGECAWCEGKYMPAGCMTTTKAKYLPEMVATCKMPKQHDSVALLSGVNKQKGKGGSGWGPSGGDWPSGGGDVPGGGGYGPGGGGQGQGCMALKSKKKCLKGTDTEGCAWCGESSFLGSPCVSESVAKYLPSMVAKCKMGKGPKKHRDDADKVATS